MRRGLLYCAALLCACSIPSDDGKLPDPSRVPEASVDDRQSVLSAPRESRAARVVLERQGIDLSLVASSQIDAVPEGAAFVMEGTSWPCNPGTSYVYSHARAGMFLSLWNVRVADVVEFRDGAGVVCSYSVTKMVRVSADDTSWFTYSTGPSTLILQTSLGPNPAYGEFIVVAERSNP